MTNRRRLLIDPTRTRFIVECPGCGQKLQFAGIMIEDKEEMSCANCNAIFLLHLTNNKKVEVELLKQSHGRRGPAEYFDRRQRG